MPKLAGKWLGVLIDDSAGNPEDVSADVVSVDISDEFGELDTTGFGEGAENSIPGMPKFPLEITGLMNPAATTGFYTVIKGILGLYVSKTVLIKQGQNAAPTTGDPKFSGEFWCQKMGFSTTPTGRSQITASFRVMGSVAPSWGVV